MGDNIYVWLADSWATHIAGVLANLHPPIDSVMDLAQT